MVYICEKGHLLSSPCPIRPAVPWATTILFPGQPVTGSRGEYLKLIRPKYEMCEELLNFHPFPVTGQNCATPSPPLTW